MEASTDNKKRVYIRLPKKYVAALSKHYELDHGLFIEKLNPYINARYVRAYFREWGTVTWCKTSPNWKENKAVAYVGFATELEADRAEWAGPHDIGGDVEVKRIVSPKIEEDEEEENAQRVVTRLPPKAAMGLGYILEDPGWLDEELAD